jgi:hypothetical protein
MNRMIAFTLQLALLSGIIFASTNGFVVTSKRARAASASASPDPDFIRCSINSLSAAKSWEDLDDDDEEDGLPSVSPDMKYVPRNVLRQNANFVAIREAGGAELTNDVYVREPASQVFWFVGKIARISDVTLEDCVARQWNLIETHASNLRPIELFPHRGVLEIWTAPGDCEMDVVYNRPKVVFQKMEKTFASQSKVKVKSGFVGLQGELYGGGEEGFRTWRLDDGRPAKPELQSPAEEEPKQEQENRTPTDQEMKEIEKKLQGKDLNELYEEQQRREGNA